MAPVISFISEFLSSLVELLVYRGLNAPPRDHNKYLEEFEPENTEENVSVLNKALRSGEKPDKSGEISVGPVTRILREIVLDDDLLSNLNLPSHEEVENDSLNNLLEFEKDLQPPSGLAVEHK